MRGLSVGFMMFTANFMGSLTAAIMGVLQDKMDGGVTSLSQLLIGFVVGSYSLSALLFLAASQTRPSIKSEAGAILKVSESSSITRASRAKLTTSKGASERTELLGGSSDDDDTLVI